MSHNDQDLPELSHEHDGSYFVHQNGDYYLYEHELLDEESHRIRVSYREVSPVPGVKGRRWGRYKDVFFSEKDGLPRFRPVGPEDYVSGTFWKLHCDHCGLTIPIGLVSDVAEHRRVLSEHKHCPRCADPITAADLVPVKISYLLKPLAERELAR